MRRTAPILATLLALLVAALAAAPARAASPWWQVLTGSHPTHLQAAPETTEVQEVKAQGELLAAKVELNGEVIGCLAAGTSGKVACFEETGFAATQTAAGLEALLEAEAAYGEGVEVQGGPAGGEPFIVTTPGRWVAPLVVTPLLTAEGIPIGAASANVISEGSGRLVITATNLGDAALHATEEDPLTIADRLPPGVSAYGAEGFAGVAESAGPVACAVKSTELVECSFSGEEAEIRPYEAIELEIPVALAEGTGSETGEVGVSGGAGPAGAPAPGAEASQPIDVSAAPVSFGLERFYARAEEEGGAEARQAGRFPFQWTNTVEFNSGRLLESSEHIRRYSTVQQPALPRNTAVTFPAGLVGSATAVRPCPLADFFAQNPELSNACPAQSAVGVASVTVIETANLGFVRVPVPIFSLVPARGEPARFGFMPAGTPVVIDTSLEAGGDYRVTGEVRNASQLAQVLSATFTLWGVPGAPAHDSSRGWECVPYNVGPRAEQDCSGEAGGEAAAGRPEAPLLRMPVSCASSLEYGAAAEPWNAPLGAPFLTSFLAPAPLGCNRVPFEPRIADALTSRLASNPSGLDFELDMPGPWPARAEPGAIAEAQPERAEVALPVGVTLNASEAEGLATCTEADYGRERYDSKPGEGCPEASKVGSVLAHSPLIEAPIEGSLYVATPYENPTGAMIAVYLIAKIPERGVLVKQAGRVEPDPRTGQLLTTFEGLPQLPYEDFKLHFREGGRSPLITPPGCGAFQTTARFTPWSAQDTASPAPGEVFAATAPLTIERGVDGGPCPQGPAPFHPGFEAGTLNNQAGSYSPFLMHLTRGDGEQDMGKLSFVLPPGVVPKLAGIPYCPEAAIARAQSRQGPHGGTEEKEDPSCPATSQIGTTVAGAGVGNQLTYVKGKLYLAGPWHGDPISAVAVTPAVAGPFDAGVVVVREALRLNPVTHVGEVDGAASEPIPHILKGIPLNLRDLRVYADRPEFTLNPTSCEPLAATATIWGEGTALEPLAPTPVGLSSRFQAAGCASLGFKPKLAINLKGGTRRGRFPALRALYTPRPGDANLSHALVTLPHSEFLEQGHFRTICTRVQFAAGGGDGAGCPPASRYGWARAFTPLLSEPLEGPVFLRSSAHNLPDLVLALHGLVNIDLAARIDSVHGGIRTSFADVPDAPVSRFVLAMQGGRKGLIVNSTNLCRKPRSHRANAGLGAQNGRAERIRPAVRAAGCKKKRGRRGGKRRGPR